MWDKGRKKKKSNEDCIRLEIDSYQLQGPKRASLIYAFFFARNIKLYRDIQVFLSFFFFILPICRRLASLWTSITRYRVEGARVIVLYTLQCPLKYFQRGRLDTRRIRPGDKTKCVRCWKWFHQPRKGHYRWWWWWWKDFIVESLREEGKLRLNVRMVALCTRNIYTIWYSIGFLLKADRLKRL